MTSSLKFGTSGLRGLAVELEGQAARRYVAAFLGHLKAVGTMGAGRVYLGRDFRPSSAAILADCAISITGMGLEPVDCGALPTPALALHALDNDCPAIMVTGSHIPADRNGLKFYSPLGEISKADETGILAQLTDRSVPERTVVVADEAEAAEARYVARLGGVLPEGALNGLRIGVFEHSSVARDLIGRLLRHYGAETVSLGRVDSFVPVDTEAFADPVLAPMAGWVRAHGLDAVVSSDGDGDRPLLMDGRGAFVRGDVLGLITAQYLGARTVVTPVTSNSAIERVGAFETVVRTRVGSPFVVAELAEAAGPVIGFEANGGTFVGRGVQADGRALPPLETRDAILPLLCTFGLARRAGLSVAELVERLPLQQGLAGRLQDVPGEKSARFLDRLATDADYAQVLFAPHGISATALVDGVQIWTGSGEMVHFRASGNAPELRCYVEGRTAESAAALLDWGLRLAARETA